MNILSAPAVPKVTPVLDSSFRPAALANRIYRQRVKESGNGAPLVIGLTRADGTRSVYQTQVFPAGHPMAEANLPYVERLVKFLLWQKGGYRVKIGGPKEIGEYIRSTYSASGARAFDAAFMGETTYERPFEAAIMEADQVAPPKETSMPIGRHLEG